MENGKIVITCAPRMVDVLTKELVELGYKSKSISKLGVEVEGSFSDTLRLNLYLRTATRVLFLLKKFKAHNPNQLYREVYNFNWQDHISPKGYVSIDSFVVNEHITDTRFANLKVKDALVDKMQKEKGRRPDTGPSDDKTVIFLHWVEDQASIYLNTSGETIAKHGYRKLPFKAPMMESLAAAAILTSKWDKKSPFINPMCGSGTLAIEAALIATNTPPGLLRNNFGFMHVNFYDPIVWAKLKNEAKKQIQRPEGLKIIATDLSNRAISAARQNAEVAGMADLIEFLTCDFRKTEIPKDKKGVVFFNPEYGERLGEEDELVEIYRNIGDFFKKNCQGYRGYIFTGNLNLAKKVGLKTARKVEFFNGRIDSRLLEYDLYAGSKK